MKILVQKYYWKNHTINGAQISDHFRIRFLSHATLSRVARNEVANLLRKQNAFLSSRTPFRVIWYREYRIYMYHIALITWHSNLSRFFALCYFSLQQTFFWEWCEFLCRKKINVSLIREMTMEKIWLKQKKVAKMLSWRQQSTSITVNRSQGFFFRVWKKIFCWHSISLDSFTIVHSKWKRFKWRTK